MTKILVFELFKHDRGVVNIHDSLKRVKSLFVFYTFHQPSFIKKKGTSSNVLNQLNLRN